MAQMRLPRSLASLSSLCTHRRPRGHHHPIHKEIRDDAELLKHLQAMQRMPPINWQCRGACTGVQVASFNELMFCMFPTLVRMKPPLHQCLADVHHL